MFVILVHNRSEPTIGVTVQRYSNVWWEGRQCGSLECTAHGSVYVAVSAVAVAVLLTRSGKDALATEDMVIENLDV